MGTKLRAIRRDRTMATDLLYFSLSLFIVLTPCFGFRKNKFMKKSHVRKYNYCPMCTIVPFIVEQRFPLVIKVNTFSFGIFLSMNRVIERDKVKTE